MERPEDTLLRLSRSGSLPPSYVYPASLKRLEPGFRGFATENRWRINAQLSPRRDEDVPPLHFDYMDGNFPNAIAFQYGGHAFVIVTLQLIEQLWYTSGVLSASAKIASLIGISPPESRLQEGVKLALFANQILFLAMHEYAHHRLGHVGTSSKEVLAVWTETPTTEEKAKLVRQAQELHADALAIYQALTRHFQARNSLVKLLGLNGKSISDEQSLGLLLIGVIALFEASPQTVANEATAYTLAHPPRDLRVSYYLRDWMMRWCRPDRPDLETWLTDSRFSDFLSAVSAVISGSAGLARHLAEMEFLQTAEGGKYFRLLEQVHIQQIAVTKEVLDRVAEQELSAQPGPSDTPEQLQGEDTTQGETRKELADALRNRHSNLIKDGQVEAAATALQELRQLSERNPEDVVLPGILARALSDHCDALALRGQSNESLALVEGLARLLQQHPEDATIPGKFAGALGTGFYVHHDAGQLSDSGSYVDRLLQLQKDYPSDVLIRKILVKVLVERLRDLASVESLAELTTLTAAARSLHQRYSDDDEILEVLVDAILLRSENLVTTGRPDSLLPLIAELRLLHRQSPENQRLCRGLANSIGNLSSYLGSSGRFSESADLVKEIAELQARHADDSELREVLAKALGNHCCQLAHSGDVVKSGAALERLRGLQREHPKETVLLGVLAEVLYDRSVSMIKLGLLDRAKAITEELWQVRHHYPSDTDCGRLLATALLDLFRAFAEADRPSEFESIARELRRLHGQLQDPTVRQQLARVLTFMAMMLKGDRSRLAERMELLRDVRGLYEEGRDPAIGKLLDQAGPF